MTDCLADDKTLSLHTASHNILKDFDLMLSAIAGPERKIFMQACREYQYSLEAAIFGSYRHAFSSLRLAFELFLATIYFSAHQMKLHLWLSGHGDILWHNLNDPDNGVFSHNFVKAFFPDLAAYRAQYMGLSSTIYRECSEYVHGNPETHEDTTRSIEFDREKLAKFHDKVTTVRLCILFAFVTRYLCQLEISEKSKLEALILDAFGNVAEIHAEFGVAAK